MTTFNIGRLGRYYNIKHFRIVTVSWSTDQLEENNECVDKFEVGVENIGDNQERKLCSVGVKTGVDDYDCRLDVSNEKYCGHRFGFWITAVNVNNNRGVERVQTFANTIIDVNCDNETDTIAEKVIINNTIQCFIHL